MKKNSFVSAVRYLIFIVVKIKQRSKRSDIFPFNSSEEKQLSYRSQIFHFNSSDSKWA